MKNSTYEKMAVEALKQFGQQLVEDAEMLVTPGMHKAITVWIRIPSNGDELDIPTMEIEQEFVPKDPERLFYGVKED